MKSTHTLFALATLAVATASADRPYAAWIQEYDPTFSRSQDAAAVATDASGNVFVTGIARDGSDVARFYTAKYSALDGRKVWEAFEQSGSTIFVPKAIAVDGEGDVIVTGYRNNGNIDYYTVKYRGTDGSAFWGSPKTFNGTADGQDEPVKVVTDSTNNIYVTGFSRGNNNGGNASGFDFVTIKYASNGTQLASDTYATPGGNGDDVPADLKIDSAGRVVIAGKVTVSGNVRLYVRRLTSGLVFDRAIAPLDIGGDAGAAAVAVDSQDNVIVTGQFRSNGTNQHGFYTKKLAAADFSDAWVVTNPPLSTDLTGQPTAIAVDPDDNPIVTGFLRDGSDNVVIKTIKYTANGFFGGAIAAWEFANTIDHGLGQGDSFGRAIAIDGAGNPIVVGETVNEDQNTDFYIARYDGLTGKRTYATVFNGTFTSSVDKGVAVAVDGNGGFAALGTGSRNFSGTARNEIVTIKFNRFLVASDDDLPDDPGVPVDARYASGNVPAVADDGAVAARITLASGKTKLGAIFTQTAAGKTVLPAVQKGPAPGLTNAKFGVFSDPIVSLNGAYAFAAKVTGVPGNKANGVWTNLGGNLHLALQQGTPVPGLAENLSSVMSLSLSNTRLVALVKLAAPGAKNIALVSIDAANNGTVLMRTGNMVMANGKESVVQKITTLSPATASPGDGRWHRGNNTAFLVTLADKRVVVFHPNSGTLELVTGGANFNPKSFGLPALSPNGLRFATLLTRNSGNGITAANDSLIIRTNAAGTAFEQVAVEGANPMTASLNTLTFAGFADPLIDNNRNVLFLATLKGAGVKGTSSKALLFGPTHVKVARMGDPATDSSGATDTAAWSGFVAHTLSGSSPVFVAKLAGSGVTGKNNLGLWARDSQGVVRRLLRTGDVLGTQTVKSFTLLKAVPTAFAAARSVNSTGGIAVLVDFTDKTQALMKLAVP